MNLRPYQRAALQISKEKYKAGITRQLLALPTGTGKTVIFACLPEHHQLRGKTLVLVHREELADQAADKIRRWNPHLQVGVEMGTRKASAASDIVVASVQTIGRKDSPRLRKFRPEEFRVVICDEAHHSTAKSYRTVFEHFGLLKKDSEKLLFGVTATPNRGDGRSLDAIYEEIVFQMSMLDAIADGWLADIRGLRVRTPVNLDRVHVLAGDFVQDELAAAVNTSKRNEIIVKSWLEHAGERQTVAFTVDIAHAQELAAAFRNYGVPAEAIWGDDPERAEKLRKHKAGAYKVITNCSVLTEGYDDWRIGCIVMARPTKSELLFVQMTGRGCRIPAGIDNLVEARRRGARIEKQDCLLIDVTDNASKHALVTLSNICGLPAAVDLQEMSVLEGCRRFREAQHAYPEIDFSRLENLNDIRTYVERVDLFRRELPPEMFDNSTLRWRELSRGASYVVFLNGNGQIVTYQNTLHKWNVHGRTGGQEFREEDFDSVAEAVLWAERHLRSTDPSLAFTMRRDYGKKRDGVTLPQFILLRRLYPDMEAERLESLSEAEASQMIRYFHRPFYSR